jgi:hypothetical protein
MLTINQMQPVSVTLVAQAGNNQLITVTGSISPAITGANIQVTYTAPDGSQTTHQVAVNTDGTYQDTFQASMTGTWTVIASWQGNSNYSPASSTPVTVTIQQSSVLMNPTLLIAIGLGVVVVVLAIALLRRRPSTQGSSTQTQPTTSTVSSVFCRSCGTKNDASHDFCSKCGKKLG